MGNNLQFYAASPRNLADLMAKEVTSCGGENLAETPTGIYFSGSLETACRFLVWSRVGSRLFLQLKTFEAETPEDIYKGVYSHPWDTEFDASASFTISTDLIKTTVVNHQNFASQKMKDAIVDQFREKTGERPQIDNKKPDITLHLLIKENTAVLGMDLGGESLHQRGYRTVSGPAPLKENVAAAILLRSGWPEIAEKGGPFIDPFCGTGTLLIEAAMIAGDTAPGLLKRRRGMDFWKRFNPEIMENVLREAGDRRAAGENRIPRIYGFDKDKNAVASALKNISSAGFDRFIHVEKRNFENLSVSFLPPGLMVSNPPYGERLDEIETLIPLYKGIGAVSSKELRGWKIAVLSGDIKLSKAIGLKPDKVNTVFNGPIECSLGVFRIYSDKEKSDLKETISKKISERTPSSPGAEMFANRLRKNLKALRKWVSGSGVTSYRIYDADMSEYSAAIDYYEGKWLNLQEYAPPKEIPLDKVKRHREEMIDGLLSVIPVYKQDLFIKVRKRQAGKSQYNKISTVNDKKIIHENGHSFYINLSDYLDTGIFLDHRETRKLIESMAGGKRFLNLFAYTGTATVYAAAGGAHSTTTVDMSSTYLEWAKENMNLNGFTGDNHRFLKADVLTWLQREKKKYDLIFLDPPTFSNSKSMDKTFDIQRDYPDLLHWTTSLLNSGGTCIFSTNFRKFKLDSSIFPELEIKDISEETIPVDFSRNKKIHYCWEIRRKQYD